MVRKGKSNNEWENGEIEKHDKRCRDKEREKEKKIEERLKRLSLAEGTKRTPSKRQEDEEKKDREEARRELRRIKRKIEEKKKLERKCNTVIRWLEEKKKDTEETVREFIEKEFGITDGIEKIEITGNKGREVTVVKLKDWKIKMGIMKEKGKLGKKKIHWSRYDKGRERGAKNYKGKSQ